MRVLLVVLALVCGVCYAGRVGYGGRGIGFNGENFGGFGGHGFGGSHIGRHGGGYYGRNLRFGGFNRGSFGGHRYGRFDGYFGGSSGLNFHRTSGFNGFSGPGLYGGSRSYGYGRK
ncbi:neuropeptide-like protein 29 [Homarus americanus]|uniref:neuropeptide-like protein 29 n=1 Tax=Homarus americanus TaxID=6706 RepID=UPI001C4749A8|nr:neuropeptide-like protein 29 [Homarus americanus]